VGRAPEPRSCGPSGVMAMTRASARARAESVNSPSISPSPAGTRSTRFCASSSFQVIGSSDHEDLGIVYEGTDNSLSISEAGAKLFGGVNRRIDLSGNAILCFPKWNGQLVQTHLPHHEEIDVACRTFLAASQGAVDESEGDPTPHWSQGFTNEICEPGRLRHQSSDLGKEGAIRVRPEVDVLSFLSSTNDFSAFQIAQLTLKARLGHPNVTGKVAHEPVAAWLHEESGQDLFPCRRKECVGSALSTHIAYICTLFRTTCQGAPDRLEWPS